MDIYPDKIAWIGVKFNNPESVAWALSDTGEVLAENRISIAAPNLEASLRLLVGSWLKDNSIDVIACGDINSPAEITKHTLLAAPTRALSGRIRSTEMLDRKARLFVLSGTKQNKPADFMLAESIMVAGLVAKRSDFDGVVCVPGKRTKWVRVSAGEIISFQSHMTGELISVLSERSVLSHSVQSDRLDRAEFKRAVLDTSKDPSGLTANLFRLRSEVLVHGLSSDIAKARVHGFLIGAEIIASRAYWRNQNVVLIGSGSYVDLYAEALASLDVSSHTIDENEAVRAGLIAAHHYLQES